MGTQVHLQPQLISYLSDHFVLSKTDNCTVPYDKALSIFEKDALRFIENNKSYVIQIFHKTNCNDHSLVECGPYYSPNDSQILKRAKTDEPRENEVASNNTETAPISLKNMYFSQLLGVPGPSKPAPSKTPSDLSLPEDANTIEQQ